jgi:hypothetical protein
MMQLSNILLTLQEARDQGCKTRRGQIVLELADFIVEFRSIYRAAAQKCALGAAATAGPFIQHSNSTSSIGAGSKTLDVWTPVQEMTNDAVDVLDFATDDRQLSGLRESIVSEIQFIRETFEYYRY